MMRQSIYGILLLVKTAWAQSDVPSDVPSYVPTFSPVVSNTMSSLPTIKEMTGPYDECPICPEGQVIGKPDFEIPNSEGQTCATANAAGLAGNIPPNLCVPLQQQGPLLCQCMEENITPQVPSPSNPNVDCTPNSCGTVTTWGVLAAFIDAASSGDYLCMCGRDFMGDMCATKETTVRLSASKDITIECAFGNLCTFNCAHPAMVISGGSVTVVGNEGNFEFTGGINYSRVLVEGSGAFTASNVVFKNTAASSTDSATSRMLQTANGRGGAIQSSGTLTVEDSTFENCTAALEGGAIYVGGGTATVSGSLFKENKAFEGGAIFVESGAVSVTRSTFQENAANSALEGGDDIFARAAADFNACANTGAYDDECSGVAGRAWFWSALGVIVATGAFFA